MAAPSVPTMAIGYVNQSYNSSTNSWWMYDGETTPELRWPQSVSVYDAMRTQDAQVGSVLEAVVRPILRTTWRLDPAGARPEVVEFCADDLGLPIVGENPEPPPRTKDRFSWLEHLELALLMLPFGYSYFEQIYRVDGDGARAHLGKLELRPAKTIDKIDVARDGGLISITQCGTLDYGMQRSIPVNRLVAYIYKKEGANWLGRSILRQAYKNWLIKDRLLRVQAQTIERNGMGIPLYKDAEGASATDHAAGLAIAKAWRAGEASGTAIPFGADLSLVGVSGTLPDAQPAIDYHDNQIARAVLAHFLNLGQQSGTGSYALGVTFADFFTASLQTLAQQVADVATQHIVEDLVDINWGPNEPAPKITFDEIGSRQQATAQSIVALINAGALTPDERLEQTLRQQYGLPPKEDQFLVDQPDGPAAPVDVAAVEVQASAHIDDGDDDEPGQFDEATAALIAALADFTGEVYAAADFNEDLHPRGPGGKFRSTFARIQRALADWHDGNGPDDPLAEFKDREPLRDAAKKRGVALRRGATRDQIRDALLDDIREKRAAARGEEAPAKPSHRLTLSSPPHRDQDVGVYQERVKVSPEQIRDVEVENAIRQAYRDALGDGPGRVVSLADIRDRLAEDNIRNTEFELALKRMITQPGVLVIPESNQSALTPRQRSASVRIGGQDKHHLSIADPSDRPLPSASKISLYRESSTGQRGARIVSVDSLEALQAWGEEHNEPQVSSWAASERGVKAPAKKVAPRKAAPKKAPAKAAPRKAAASKLTQDDFADGLEHRPGTGDPFRDTSERLKRKMADRVAERWDVSREDFDALAAAEAGSKGDSAAYADMDLDEAKRKFLVAQAQTWGGGPGRGTSAVAIAAVAERLGADVELTEYEQGVTGWAAARPDVKKAIANLGEAMYTATQDWFRERGITHVSAERSTNSPDGESHNLITSWSLEGQPGFMHAEPGTPIRQESIPVERIFSIPPTGYGIYEETEMVVMPPTRSGKPAARKTAKAAPERPATAIAPAADIAQLQALVDFERPGTLFGTNAVTSARRALARGDSAQDVAEDLRRQSAELEQLPVNEIEVGDRTSVDADSLRSRRNSDARKLNELADALEAANSPTPAKKATPPAIPDLDNPDLGSDQMSQDIMGLLSAGWTPDEVVAEMPEIAEPQARAYVAEIVAMMKARQSAPSPADSAFARMLKTGSPPIPGQLSAPRPESSTPSALRVRDVAAGLGFDFDRAATPGERTDPMDIAERDARMLTHVQAALDGEAAPALGIHRPGGSYAAIGRGLERWANGSSGPYYAAVHAGRQGHSNEGRADEAAALREQGDRWVALAKMLQGMRREPGSRPIAAPSAPRAPKPARGPKAPRAAREPGADFRLVPAETLDRVSSGLAAAGTVEEGRRVLDAENLSKGQFLQLASDLGVPLISGSGRDKIRDDIVKVKVEGRLTTQVLHNALLREPDRHTSLDSLDSLRSLDTEARRDALDERKLPELKAMLKAEGLPVSGRKRELVDRLVAKMDADAPKVDAPEAKPAGSFEDRVTAASTDIASTYRRLTRAPGTYVKLADLRRELPGHDRDAVDEALRRYSRQPGVNVIGETATARTPADDEAAVMIGHQPAHVIAFEDDVKRERGEVSEPQVQAAAVSVIDAYRRARRPGSSGWVKMVDLRRELGDHDRDAVDEALKRIGRVPGADVIGEVNQKILTPQDRAAAVFIGGRRKDLINIEDDVDLSSVTGAPNPDAPDVEPPAETAARPRGGGDGPKADAPGSNLPPARRAPATPVPIHDLIDADDATITAALRDVYEGQFGPYTTRIQVGIRRAGTRTDSRGREHAIEPSIWVEGKIYDRNGHEIGNFGRAIGPSDRYYPDGTVRREVWAEHDIVQLGNSDEDRGKYQGKGFGGAFNRRVIDWYRASGVHGIAQDDHNFYVWASQGFDFRGGVVPNQTSEAMRELIADLRAGKTKNRFGEPIPKALREAPDRDAQIAAAEAVLARLESTQPGQPGYPTAYEISQLGRREGQRGKTATWFGKVIPVPADELILNPDEGEVIS